MTIYGLSEKIMLVKTAICLYEIVKHFQEKAAEHNSHYLIMDLHKDKTLRSVF